MMAKASYKDLALYRRLLHQLRPYWAHLTALLLLGLLGGCLALLTPLPLKIAVDSVVGSWPLPGFLDALVPGSVTGSDTAVLLLAAGIVVAVVVLSQLQGLASSL